MKNLMNKTYMPGAKAGTALLSSALLQFAAGPAAAAGERESALALCRSAIAEAFQVTANEAGAHFRESTTTARAYTMRFDVRTKSGATPLLTCKVKRGALVIAELSQKGPGAVERAELAGAAESAQPVAQ